jgi:hypothetical protein
VLDRFRRFWTPHLEALGTELARGKRAKRVYSLRFSKPGTYKFACLVHPLMVGTLVGLALTDGREYRAVGDAHTIDLFSARLRDEVDMETLRAELLAHVTHTM